MGTCTRRNCNNATINRGGTHTHSGTHSRTHSRRADHIDITTHRSFVLRFDPTAPECWPETIIKSYINTCRTQFAHIHTHTRIFFQLRSGARTEPNRTQQHRHVQPAQRAQQCASVRPDGRRCRRQQRGNRNIPRIFAHTERSPGH